MADHLPGQGCGCCTELDILAPIRIDNPPGQPTLRRRVGTHATFTARLHAGLSRRIPTRGLTTRESDDFAIALLDAWATVADNVTFYTERIANEHYVGTAVERRSMTELARLIGRSLQPGLAAEADLAFSMDSTPGAPDRLELEAGSAVQSDPEPGGEPAVYETIETREVRPAWNRLRARAFTPSTSLGLSPNQVHLAGASTGLKVGNAIAWHAPGGWNRVGIITAVETVDGIPATPNDPGRPARTVLTLDVAWTATTDLPSTVDLGQGSSVAGLTGAAAWLDGRTVTAAVLEAEAAERRTDLRDIEASVAGRVRDPGSLVVFRLAAGLFGSAAPSSASLAQAMRDELIAIGDDDLTEQVEEHVSSGLFPWDSSTAATLPAGDDILLDAGYPTVTSDSVVALFDGVWSGIYRVDQASVGGHAEGGVSGKTTRLELHGDKALSTFGIRETTVFAQSEPIARAFVPDDSVVSSTTVELESLAIGLAAGRTVVVTGPAVDDPGRTLSHLTRLAEVTHHFGAARNTTLTLAEGLPEALIRAEVTVNANVVRASHGFTRSDVLGSGDGRQPFQQFTLSERPLTYLSASTESGRVSTLRMFVNDVEWYEVGQLPGRGPNDRVFVSRETESGTVVQFGDGLTGARLPTGVANVRAVYRAGAGFAGRVGANRLTTLASRPAGLAGVANPVKSEGGAEPETAGQARSNISLEVRTLGRVVSLRDYEDFARSFSGVAKARATWARSGGRRGVVITVAGDEGDALPPGSPIHDSLVEAFAKAGDSLVPVHLVDHQPRQFRVAADLRIRDGYQTELVREAVDTALRSSFDFDKRGLGQSVFASELLETMHSVPGVLAADLTLLVSLTFVGPLSSVPDVLHAAAPQPGVVLANVSAGAALLTIEPHPVSLGDLT